MTDRSEPDAPPGRDRREAGADRPTDTAGATARRRERPTATDDGTPQRDRPAPRSDRRRATTDDDQGRRRRRQTADTRRRQHGEGRRRRRQDADSQGRQATASEGRRGRRPTRWEAFAPAPGAGARQPRSGAPRRRPVPDPRVDPGRPRRAGARRADDLADAALPALHAPAGLLGPEPAGLADGLVRARPADRPGAAVAVQHVLPRAVELRVLRHAARLRPGRHDRQRPRGRGAALQHHVRAGARARHVRGVRAGPAAGRGPDRRRGRRGAATRYAPWLLAQAGHLHVLSNGGIPLALAMLARGHGWSLRHGYRPERRHDGWVVAGWLVAAWQLSLGFGIGLPFAYFLAGVGAGRRRHLFVRAAGCDRAGRPFGRRLFVADVLGGVLFAGVGRAAGAPVLQGRRAAPVRRAHHRRRRRLLAAGVGLRDGARPSRGSGAGCTRAPGRRCRGTRR